MPTTVEVLKKLRPTGWTLVGDDFKDVQYLECEPITQAEFDSAFASYDADIQAEQDALNAQRQAILDKLGLTVEEAQLLLGGN